MSSKLLRALTLVELNDVEDILLYLEACKGKPLQKIKHFRFKSFSEEFCIVNFRFEKQDLNRLKKCLKIPSVVICDNGLRFTGLEGLCVLRRLAYPNRYVDLMAIFPRTQCELSRIFKKMITLVKRENGDILKNLKQPYITSGVLEDFAESIRLKGSPYKNCVGFIDGTVRAMCRPTENQREYYNGHKRAHALKFQSVMLPNGLVGSMHGPIQGRRHDAYILHESKIMDQVEDLKDRAGESSFYLYGDPAYPLKRNLIVPFKGRSLTPAKLLCNKKMSRVRQAVEWGFGKMLQIFAFLDFKKNLMMGKSPIGDYYLVAALLTNCHTCLYGSKTSDYFLIIPPTLEEYLSIE